MAHMTIEELVSSLDSIERSLMLEDFIDDAVESNVDAALSLQEKGLLRCYALTDSEGWWCPTDLGETVRRHLFTTESRK